MGFGRGLLAGLVGTCVVIIMAGVFTLFYDLAAPSTQGLMDQASNNLGTQACGMDLFLGIALVIVIGWAIIRGLRR